jgi:hypothetical protein
MGGRVSHFWLNLIAMAIAVAAGVMAHDAAHDLIRRWQRRK